MLWCFVAPGHSGFESGFGGKTWKKVVITSDPSYRREACQHLDPDLVDLEVKGSFPH